MTPPKLKLPSPKFSWPLLIRESHLDTFGHVNNATYLEIFEEARWDLLENNGYGLKHIQKIAQGPVIVEINLKFIKEVHNREHVRIDTWCETYPGKVGVLVQTMHNEKNDECCRADFKFGLFDLKARKLIDPTHDWLRAIGVETDATP